VAFADYFGRSSLGVIRGVTEPFATVGQSVGAVLSGAIYDSTKSYRGAFFVLAAVATVAMLILLLARPPARASVSAPPESREPG
jgi:sugar phosphate permease